MIRGPVLPEARAALWALVAPRLDLIERGLSLCCEALDCSEGRFGVVDGLARDASGAPVLVIVASDDDAHLAPRVHAAAAFLGRVADGLVTAVPEAALCPGQPGRVLVVGGPAATTSLELLRRLLLPSLEVCRLEAFRIGAVERFAVRWLAHEGGAAVPSRPPSVEFDVPNERREEWRAVQRLCERLDPSIRIDGGRFQQRITWHGRPLAELVTSNGDLFAIGSAGDRQPLVGARDVRGFSDALLRRYLRAAGIDSPHGSAPGRNDAPAAAGSSRSTETLRETLTASRLSAEEYSMLGGPTCVAMAESDGGNAADYVARMVGEPDGSWTEPRSRD